MLNTNIDEKVIAIVDPTEAEGEHELAQEVTSIEVKAGELVVSSDEEYEEAGKFGVILKNQMAKVTDFFAPMKKSAHEAHKQICDREKEMLNPLKDAEKALKKTMGDYALKKERERRAAEEAARRLAQEEAERKLALAIEAEKEGKIEESKSAIADAQIAEHVSRNFTIEEEKPTAKGVSMQTDWEITEINGSEVPITIAGTVIRPVDTAAVMRLIRASKGTIEIRGIKYKEVAKMSFRRS